MNIRQFQYILAVAENRHFEKAADQCFISQSTLSTMISKFEDEIGIRIFDRKKKPVEVTSEGAAVIAQLRLIHREIDQLNELTKEIKGEIKGNLSVSVIPTIAPFLLPRFLQPFATRCPDLNIQVREETTSEILRKIESRELDIGIISIPVDHKDIVEEKLYDEPFVLYDAATTKTQPLHAGDMDTSNLCLLEEGHCMRTQVINLCDAHKMKLNSTLSFEYKAGSIDSLMRFVKANEASTLLPYLATIDLPEEERQKLSAFVEPVPYRTIGLVVHRHFVKRTVFDLLKQSILDAVKKVLPQMELEGEELRPV